VHIPLLIPLPSWWNPGRSENIKYVLPLEAVFNCFRTSWRRLVGRS
jgi:hypothetical protein